MAGLGSNRGGCTVVKSNTNIKGKFNHKFWEMYGTKAEFKDACLSLCRMVGKE